MDLSVEHARNARHPFSQMTVFKLGPDHQIVERSRGEPKHAIVEPTMTVVRNINQMVEDAVASRTSQMGLADAPNRAAFFGGEAKRLTWGQVDSAIGSVAASLQALGVSAGSAVAIQLPNIVELPISILATIRLGATAVPFPIQHRTHELRHGFATANVDVAVTAARPDRPDQIESICSVAEEFGGLPVAVFGGDPDKRAIGIDLESAGSEETHRAELGDVATICWTSGTTGTPKGVPRTHANWASSSSLQVEDLAITSEDRILCPFPVVNMAGIGGMLLPWVHAGAALHLHQPLDLPVFLQQVNEEEITYTVAPPPLLNMLLRDEALLSTIDLTHMRAISSGSAPLDPWMVDGWEERGVEIVNVFGSNEGVGLLSTRAGVPDPAQRARYFPRPTRPGVDVKIVDLESNQEITTVGQPGELRLKGPSIFSGYIDSAGQEFDEDGYFRTGDVFELAGEADPPELLRFVDRAKDIIIRGGMNVSAAEVEALVSSHDAIVECAAVGYADRDLGERVGVFVVAAQDQTPELGDVVGHLRQQDIASYKLPERLEIIEALPRNPVGKVVKSDLRELWAND